MRLQRFTAPAALLLAIALATPAAFAQSGNNATRRRPGDRSARTVDSGNRNQDTRRDGARAGVAVARPGARVESPRGAGGGQAGRTPASPVYDARQNARGDVSRRDNSRPDAGRRVDDRYASQRDDGRNSGQWRSTTRSYGPYGSYDRNVWRGRIRFGLGISILAGRPFAFRFDYGWMPRFSYYYTMRPGLAYGGVAFLLNPDYAEVYIDGQFVGIARDFGGQPVPVAAGFHRIELYAPGFEPVAFDIDVLPGQMIPYRGSLYPVY